MNPAQTLPAHGAAVPLLIEGPNGPIEALFAAPRPGSTPRGAALICHPHPLYGGAMTNKVVHTLASCATQAGDYALRFNFRGVGKSAGVHDQARGEVDDAVWLAQWLREQVSGPLSLGGFSFGGYVALHAAARVQPARLVTVAPPITMYGERVPPAPSCPWLLVHSADDDTVPISEADYALRHFHPPPQVARMDGAGHFFNGQLGPLSALVLSFMQQNG